MFGIDIETGGLALDDELRLVQISNGEDTFVIDVRESDPRPLLQEFTGDELVAHNANFEESRLKRHLGIEYPEPMHDTMVMSQVLYAGTPTAQSMSHALDAAAMRELGIELDKEFQKADWSGEITPEMYEYAKTDAEVLVPLAKHLAPASAHRKRGPHADLRAGEAPPSGGLRHGTGWRSGPQGLARGPDKGIHREGERPQGRACQGVGH